MSRSIQHHSLVKRVFQLRQNRFTYKSLSLPQCVDFDEVRTSQGWRRRCRVVLTAHGCRTGTCTMCPLPDESVPLTVAVTTQHWLGQLQSALPAGEHADIFTLFHNGNFFSDLEVPVERREAVYAWLRTTGVTTLVVESLPQFVTAQRVEHAAQHLGPGIKLEVAIGLQSMDPFLRETVLASTCTDAGFKQALAALRQHGFEAQVFLMHQMPFLTAEESSVALAESVRELASVYGILAPTLSPLRIAEATVTHELYASDALKPASLWHLVDVLAYLRREVPLGRARVAVHSAPPDGQEQPRAHSCPDCDEELRRWIAAFSVQAEGAVPPRCACAATPVDFSRRYRREVVERRIQDYLDSLPVSPQRK